MRIKFVISLIIIIYFIKNTYSQDNSDNGFNINISVGPSFIHTTTSFTFENELTYRFNKLISSGVGFAFSNGHKEFTKHYFPNETYIIRYQETIYTIELKGFVSPIYTSRQILNFGIGLGYNFHNNIELDSNITHETIISHSINDVFFNQGFGYNFSIKYAYRINDKFMIGIKGYVNKFKEFNESIMLITGFKIG